MNGNCEILKMQVNGPFSTKESKPEYPQKTPENQQENRYHNRGENSLPQFSISFVKFWPPFLNKATRSRKSSATQSFKYMLVLFVLP